MLHPIREGRKWTNGRALIVRRGGCRKWSVLAARDLSPEPNDRWMNQIIIKIKCLIEFMSLA